MPVICRFERITLTAINWNVALIYRNLGFVPTRINERGDIEMELNIRGVANILIINRVGFLFTVLQEIPSGVLTSGNIANYMSGINSIISSNYAKREQIISTIGVPGKLTASIESIKMGGRRRRGRGRRTQINNTRRRKRSGNRRSLKRRKE